MYTYKISKFGKNIPPLSDRLVSHIIIWKELKNACHMLIEKFISFNFVSCSNSFLRSNQDSSMDHYESIGDYNIEKLQFTADTQ